MYRIVCLFFLVSPIIGNTQYNLNLKEWKSIFDNVRQDDPLEGLWYVKRTITTGLEGLTTKKSKVDYFEAAVIKERDGLKLYAVGHQTSGEPEYLLYNLGNSSKYIVTYPTADVTEDDNIVYSGTLIKDVDHFILTGIVSAGMMQYKMQLKGRRLVSTISGINNRTNKKDDYIEVWKCASVYNTPSINKEVITNLCDGKFVKLLKRGTHYSLIEYEGNKKGYIMNHMVNK